MKKHLAVSIKEVLDLLQRKRRHGRSLTGVELASLLDRALKRRYRNYVLGGSAEHLGMSRRFDFY